MGSVHTKENCGDKIEEILVLAKGIKDTINEYDSSGLINNDYIINYAIPLIEELSRNHMSPEGKNLLKDIEELVENYSAENIRELKKLSEDFYRMIEKCSKTHKCSLCQTSETYTMENFLKFWNLL